MAGKKLRPLRITTHIQGPSQGRFGQAYIDRLDDLLAAHFTAVTGLVLNGKRWFMFNAWKEVQSPEPSVFTLLGDIIGPDSVGYDAEITWREEGGWPVVAGWRQLPVRALQRDYGEIQPPVVSVGAMPFEVEWRAWWDSHLPDFYLEVVLATGPGSLVAERLRTFIDTLEPAYESVTTEEARIQVHVDFGMKGPVHEQIVKLMGFVRELHGEYPVSKVAVGVGE